MIKRILTLCLAALMCLAFVGCSKTNNNNPEPTAVPNGDPQGIAYLNEVGTIAPLTVYKTNGRVNYASEVDPLMLAANNIFAANMINALGDGWTGVFSPFSIQVALEILANGGDDATAERLLNAVCPGMTREAVNMSAARLLTILKGTDGIMMDTATVVNNNYRLALDFANKAANYYGSSVGALDFNDPEAAMNEINNWVSNNTGKLIEKMFDDLGADTAIVILNVMTLKLNWESSFATLREQIQFNGLNGTLPTSVMAAWNEYSYGEFENGRMAVVPFEGGEYAAAFILPAEGVTPSAAAASMLSSMNLCKPGKLYIKIPKVELKSRIDVMKMADNLGLREAFDGHYPLLINDDSVAISRVEQSSVFFLNEEGVTASSATAVVGTKGANENPPSGYIDFTCDRPFAILIYHVATGTVLYVSIVNDIG